MPFETDPADAPPAPTAPVVPFTAYVAPNLPPPPLGVQFTGVGMVRIRGRRNKLARGLDCKE